MMTSQALRAQSDERDWRLRAACRSHDPDLWFANESDAATTRALAICEGCPVQSDCEDVSRGEVYGVWGGRTSRGRAHARRKAAQVAAALARKAAVS